MLLLLACTQDEPPFRPTRDTGQSVPTETISRQASITGLPDWQHPTPDAKTTSGFGFREVDDDVEFHLGIDLHAPIGTPIVAPADGTVWRIHPSESTSDPNTLYIRHEVDPVMVHGLEITEAFSMYSHIDTFEVQAEDQFVQAGQVIATVGESGQTVSPHLHFEVRLGTWCTLDYSTRNPDSGCAAAYDPSINPLHLISGRTEAGLELEVLSEGRYAVSTRPGDLDWNRLTTDAGTFDLDLRTGLDATDDDLLDDPDLGWVLVQPTGNDDDHARWELELEAEWLEVTDIDGEGVRLDVP
ncbi:MAG: M23 family metallopeptidase [Proteobacteria bacterium]|nr:M23 family metallopeptidase [Pseudomonadota bacterium]MCP4920536.1 M23 family metallopeptidase [Pseudomonadota bacterium]